ncbi:hypothetical protein K501DRAFT_231016 [Backusella circina FSU 941]|nr:hypothetical protein K501DRAFT_231016 [Backusella circina FSU 941]
MKFLTLTSMVCAVVVGVSAQITAPTRNYNVTSPVSNGPYVIGQILPCTYRLFSDVDSSALNLQIDLESAAVGVNTTTVPIAITADVSKTDAFVKREGNLTYYEHSINFNIPQTVKPGNYRVIFFDKSTNTKLPIPIEIRPAAATTSTGFKTQSTGVPGHSQSSGSIFAQGASSINTPTKTLIALAAVAGIAFLL